MRVILQIQWYILSQFKKSIGYDILVEKLNWVGIDIATFEGKEPPILDTFRRRMTSGPALMTAIMGYYVQIFKKESFVVPKLSLDGDWRCWGCWSFTCAIIINLFLRTISGQCRHPNQ